MEEPASNMSAAPLESAKDPVRVLESRLGFPLANVETALAALTHKSFVNEHRGEGLIDNERLEFLGDAVIDLAVSHRLMERFPQAREGELSKLRAAVVDEAGLAQIARELDLGSLLRLGRGEELTGGRQKASLLADAFEAVIAALYLGGGLEQVLGLVDRFLAPAFAQATAGTLDRDYKTQLQELAQSRHRATPRYRVVAEHGPEHSKVFEIDLDLRGEVLGHGMGRSKKDAEQAAAKLALEALNARGAVESAACQEFAKPTPAADTPVAAPTPALQAVPAEPHSAVVSPEPEPAPEAIAAPEPPATEPSPGPALEASPEAEADAPPAEVAADPASASRPRKRQRKATPPRKPAKARARPQKRRVTKPKR
jgi:ribonuclease-3